MRAWLHSFLTIALTLVSTIASLILTVILGFRLLDYLDSHHWPSYPGYALLLIPLCGLHLPALLMSRIPFVCPKCGAKARFGVAEGWFWASFFLGGLGGTYAQSCTVCDWSTYQWSSYYRKQQRRRARVR